MESTVNQKIVDEVVPEVLNLFLNKGRDYGIGVYHLGLKGQFSDINRKFWKLKASLWEGKELEQEQPREILMDMIGHCLLSIWLIDHPQ